MGKLLNKKQFVNRSKKIHGNKYDYSLVEYVNNSTRVKIICQKHGMFEQTPLNHINAECNCPKCKVKSKGEIKIRMWLDNNNIQYENQKRFDDCRNKNPLPFDFYISSINTIIEYDGRQHFITKPTKCWTKEALESIKKHDLIKNNYCANNNINIIRIKYTNFRSIEDILNKEIKQ